MPGAGRSEVDLGAVADELDSGLRHCVDEGEALGLSWLVSNRHEVRSGAIGHLDADATEPVSTDTIFRISSMTKPVTAAAALMLVDAGSIALGEPVDQWLPELSDRRVLSHPAAQVDDTVPAQRPITLDDLLTFRLGLGGDFSDWSPKPIDDAIAALGLGAGPPAPATPPAPDEWIRRLGTVPLQFQPGERWLYHTAAEVLGVLIARVTGKRFDEFLSERIFEPLGMADTGFFVPATDWDRFGACFTRDPTGDRTVYDPIDGQWSTPPAFPGGGAGLVSTIHDLNRFADMLRNDGSVDGRTFLAPRTVREMTINHLTEAQVARGPAPDGSTGWGFGLGVQVSPDGPSPVGTYGWDGGLGSLWRTDPTRGMVAILLTNQMWSSPVPPAVCDVVLTALRTA